MRTRENRCAARIAPNALLKPAQAVHEVEVAAVAARDRGRGQAFAARYGVPAVHDSYAGLVADPSLDAVYVPLPNGLHANLTPPSDSVATMSLIDDIYTAAGLPLR